LSISLFYIFKTSVSFSATWAGNNYKRILSTTTNNYSQLMSKAFPAAEQDTINAIFVKINNARLLLQQQQNERTKRKVGYNLILGNAPSFPY